MMRLFRSISVIAPLEIGDHDGAVALVEVTRQPEALDEVDVLCRPA